MVMLMLRSYMAMHLNGNRVDREQVAIMIVRRMSIMVYVNRMNLVSMNDRVHRRFDCLIWRVSILLSIT